MARISQYDQDGTLNKLDKVVGTDSATGATKNYTIDSMMGLVNSEDLVNVFDGVSYAFKSYEAGSTNPRGIINLNAGAAANSPFSGISQIYISVLDKHGNSIANYLDDTLNSFIRIVQKTNIDTYGVLEVTAVADHDGGAYKLLTVTPRVNNGNIVANEEYFVSNYSAVFDQDFSDDSVTEFSDVTSAGSGEIITTAERQSLNNFTANGLLHADVVDNVTSTAADVPLSANQGKVLKDLINSINTLLTSDNVDLDSLQEVVDYIEANRDTLDNLGISNISGLQAALDAKQNTEAGKGLSTEDFTTALLTKLNGIAASAEVNVQSNWGEANTGSDAFIQNKPSDLTNLTIHSVTELNDVTSAGSGAVITSAERTKLGGIEDSADVTDTANVTTAGALMDSEVTNLAQVKAFDTADYATAAQGAKADSAQQPPVEGPFVDGDKTKLDGIEPNADVTDTANVTAAGALMDSELTDEAAVKAIDQGLATTDDVDFNSIQVDDTIELITAQSTTPTFDNGIYYTTENGHDTLHFRYHGHDLSIDYLTENIPTGILNGGVLSTNTSTTFDVAAGDGVINILNKDNSDPHPEIKKVAWSATTVTHTLGNAGDANQLNTWVYVDSSGNIQQTLTIPSPALWRSNIVLGSVIHSSNVIRFVKTFPRPSYSNGNTFAEFVEIFGPLKKSGHLLTVNSTNTLALDRAAGISFGVGRNYQVDAEEPNLVSDGASTPAFHRYSSTATGFTKDDGTAGAGYTSIDPTKYDNSGTLTTASAGQYTAQRLFHFPNNTNVIVAYYGKAEYSSIDDAEKNYLLEDFQEADNTSSQAIYLGVLIVKGNATDLGNSSQAKILTGGIFRSLSATNLGGVAADAAINDLTDVNITGVANDEILQYNSSTGNWENQPGISGTGAANKLAIWDGTSSLTQDTNLHWDTTNDMLGIGTSSPEAKLHVYEAASGQSAPNAAADTLILEGSSLTGVSILNNNAGIGSIFFGDNDDNFVGGFRYNHSNNSLDTYTNNALAITINSSRNVGIGTTSPDAKLHSYGTGDVAKFETTTFGGVNFSRENTVGNNSTHFIASFNNADSEVAYIKTLNKTGATTSTGTGYELQIAAAGTGYQTFYTNGTERMRIDSSGLVSIKNDSNTTSSPTLRLDANSKTSWAIGDIIGELDFYTSDTSGNAPYSTAFIQSINETNESTLPSGSLVFGTATHNVVGGATERMRIDSSGNVGIGTTSPSVSLDINNTDAIQVPAGTTAQRPTAANGMLRYNSEDAQFEGYADGAWGAIAGSGGGSGEIVKQTFSGTGSQATFTLSDTIGDIDNISVYVSGVYQYPSNYTVSGANVIFAAGSIPALGTNNVHVVHTTTVASITEVGSVFVDQFTGNGSDTQFSPLGAVPSSANHTDVYIDGVYQQKNAYSIAGSQITFTDAPDTGAYVEVKTTGTIAPAAVNAVATNLVSDSFTATADQTSFTLTNGTPSAKELTMVFVQGVYQAKVNYSLLTSPTRIVLTEGAEVGETVEVISVSGANLTTSPVVSVNGQTGAVTFDTYTAPTVYVINTNTTAVANSVYVLTANLTLTLPTSPSSGDSIKISNRSGVATCVLARNGSNIMGSASDLTLDTASASFELIYSDATNGWVIIGQ